MAIKIHHKFSVDRTMEVTNTNHCFIPLSNPKQEVVTALIKYLFEFICNKVKREIFERRFKNGSYSLFYSISQMYMNYKVNSMSHDMDGYF